MESASSGQKKAIVLATLKHIWNRSSLKPIVLLDEPENSMHPGLTSRIFTSLNELTADNEPSFIIATHSSDIVAANAKNTYRIVTANGVSHLKKIIGLEERALVISDLGVHFHLDYVAQRIVFVESSDTGSKGGLNDATAYQLLIDPNKENYLFISCGSKRETKRSHSFQDKLLAKLMLSTPEFTSELTDRDDEDYNATKNTPFRNIEYLYIANIKLLSEALSIVSGQEITESTLKTFIPGNQAMIDVDAKKIWNAITRYFKIDKNAILNVQTYVLQKLRNDPSLQEDGIRQLLTTFPNIFS
jgi:energy-coupling factor transporter ATP-binding protein EcfA2